ncbi:Aste57867_13222 [Aphanomyces stellatus]|uniref:Aste57867_13222 protein n=1 Tax=Aphanomyces stellatus TaxID=120398 RepID=A0A485KYF6_9STRA|nr:hypothetical protein As57867_013173 [Aphanomyces stellatus]VFT90062.1 Aste57867_13222 [Aphanomyces stellatus]
MEVPAKAKPTITGKLFHTKSTRIDMSFLQADESASRQKSVRTGSIHVEPVAPTKRPKSFVHANTEPSLVQVVDGDESDDEEYFYAHDVDAMKKRVAAASGKPPPPPKDSPHIRLYALGVNLLDHKDQVHNLFSHYTSDAAKKSLEKRRSKSKLLTSTAVSSSAAAATTVATHHHPGRGLSRHGKSASYDAAGFRQLTNEYSPSRHHGDPRSAAAPRHLQTSVRSTIKHLRRKLSQVPHNSNSLVEVSRKSAMPISEKHSQATTTATMRPSVSPIRGPKSPTRLHVVVVPRRPSLYDPDDDKDGFKALDYAVADPNPPNQSKPPQTSTTKKRSPPKDKCKTPSGGSPVRPTAPDEVEAAGGAASSTEAARKADEEKTKVLQLMEQINLLKSSLGLSDEDLQWKVESAKSNAFVLADKKLAAAEEEYDRLLYEQSLLATCPFEDCTNEMAPLLKQLCAIGKENAASKAELLVVQQEVSSTKKSLMDARVSAEMKRARSNSPPRRESVVTRDCAAYETALGDQKKELLAIQEKFKQGVLKQDALQKNVLAATEAMITKFGEQACRFSSDELANAARSLMELVHELGQTTGDGLVALCERALELCKVFHGYGAKEQNFKERAINATLKQMEIWRTRREQAKEYPAEMRRLETEWKALHAAENQTCLERLCTLIPDNITAISVEQLLETAKAAGVLYTRDLANYLKQNKLLQWIVTHEKDKCRENFITGDTAQCFTNFESYDVTEMRGLSLALPDAFEFDKDGRKAEWRLAFVAHLKILVQQQRGECVKAGWDPVKGTRGDVKLKPLTEKQLLNPMYRYPTEAEIKLRLEKFETQAKRLAQKKARMTVLVNQEIPLAKKEYHAVAEGQSFIRPCVDLVPDARSEELLKQFGKPALIKLRDESKRVFQSLCKECDTLKGEIAVGERAAQTACPSYEQYVEEIAAIRELRPDVRAAVIRGPFSAHPVVKPKERAVHKKLSAEEEALARKHELSHAIAERSKEFGDAQKKGEAPPTTQIGELGAAIGDPNAATATDGGGHAAASAPPAHHMKDAVLDVMKIRAVKASPVVLSFLQNEFCGKQRRPSMNGGGAASPEKPPATSLPTMAAIPDGDEMQDDAPTPAADDAPAVPKSNALLKLMGLTTTPVLKKRPSMLHDPDLLEDLSKPNMLAEIQRRRSSKGTPPPSPLLKKAGPNFLEELKRRTEGKTSSRTTEEAAATPSTTPLPPPPARLPHPMMAAPTDGKPLNFLDELKKKAKTKE